MSADRPGCLSILGPIAKIFAIKDAGKPQTEETKVEHLNQVFQKVAQSHEAVIGELDEKTGEILFR